MGVRMARWVIARVATRHESRENMKCAEKMRLATEYEQATARFAETVRDLQQRMGTSTKSEYELLRVASDEARVASENARLALERHVVSHQC